MSVNVSKTGFLLGVKTHDCLDKIFRMKLSLEGLNDNQDDQNLTEKKLNSSIQFVATHF